MCAAERGYRLPTGEGEELNRLAKEQWSESLVELAPVENKLTWVNPNFPNLRLNFQPEKKSPLGLFAKTAFPNESAIRSLAEGSQVGEIWPAHNRTALLRRMKIADENGQLYRDIDLKGIGCVITGYSQAASHIKARVVPISEIWSGGLYGLLDRESAQYDRDRSEGFNDLGIRTSRTLAIIELSEIILDGKHISVETLRERGKMPKEFIPVIEVRAFRSKARIRDYTENDDAFGRSLLCDAKTMISQELGLGETMTDYDYYMWLAKTIGRNTALMHKNGWTHGYLNAHNLTLDGSIVDLDSVTRLARPADQKVDFDTIRSALLSLSKHIANPKFEECLMQFYDSYEDVFSSPIRDRNSYNEVVSRNVFERRWLW